LTSTFATVSTDIPSYEAIHGRMPLHREEFDTSDDIVGFIVDNEKVNILLSD